MSGTRAEAAYRRSVVAFRNPMLELLHGRHAPFVVAMLSMVFTPDRSAVAVVDAHVEVGEGLEELRALGYDEDELRLPRGTAREVCRSWERQGWIVPQIEANQEVYRLSAHAVGALEIAGRAGTGRTRVSRSRVRTLLDAVDRLAERADRDPEARLARLVCEREALDADIARLRDHGEFETADDEQLLEEAENVLHLARELPADFARVAESIKAMQRDVIADLRRDERPTGEVLREYLQRAQHVMQSTPEGRAFAGALQLIGDPERIDRLASQLHLVQAQPFARRLERGQRAELDAVGRRVEQGVAEVLTAQRRASHVITAQVRTHDPARDHQIDELLRAVTSSLHAWMHESRPGERVEPLRSFSVAGVRHLRQSVSDIRPSEGPAPLKDAPDDVEFPGGDPLAWGGPRYAELEDYVEGLDAQFDLAAAFEGADDTTRRPVDLLGLLEIAYRNGMTEEDGVSVVEALRPDGTTRRFAFGAVTARNVKESRDWI